MLLRLRVLCRLARRLTLCAQRGEILPGRLQAHVGEHFEPGGSVSRGGELGCEATARCTCPYETGAWVPGMLFSLSRGIGMSSARSKNRGLDERVRVFAHACEFWFCRETRKAVGISRFTRKKAFSCLNPSTSDLFVFLPHYTGGACVPVKRHRGSRQPGHRKKDSGRRAGHSRGRVSHLGRVPATQLREQPGDA